MGKTLMARGFKERLVRMANKLTLNGSFEKACKRLVERKVIGPTMKHDWKSMRHVVWMVLVLDVFPELGIDPSKAAMVEKEVTKDGKKVKETVPNEVMEDIMNARKAFDKAFDDGYTLESSNCGKHLADHGFARSTAEEAKVASEVFV
jgi:hypothetical protein